MKPSIAFAVKALIAVLAVLHLGVGSAMTFFYRTRDTSDGHEHVSFEVAPDLATAKANNEELRPTSPFLSCKAGWGAIVRTQREQMLNYVKIDEYEHAGACGHKDKDSAIRAAMKSCAAKPKCRTAMDADNYSFSFTVWNDPGGETLDEADFKSCGRRSIEAADQSDCGTGTSAFSLKWEGRSRFNKAGFIRQYVN